MNTVNNRQSFSICTLICGFLVTCIVLYYIGNTTADWDLWGYMAFGRLLWEQGQFPYKDVFSYVPTLNYWAYHEWLTGTLFYPLYHYFGGPGLQIFKYAIGLATVWVAYLTARRRHGSALAAGMILAMVSGGFGTGYSPVRAQVFTYYFFAFTLFLLENYRIQSGGYRRHIYWVVALEFIFWANLHGGFVAGLGLIGLYALGEAVSRRKFMPYVSCLGLAVLVTLINPYGWQYWHYLAKAMAIHQPEITEWANIFNAYQRGIYSLMILAYVFSFALFSLIVFRREASKDLTATIILLVTFAVSVASIRNLPFFFLSAGAYLPSAFKYYEDDLRDRFSIRIPRWFRTLFMTIILIASILFAVGLIRQKPFSLKVPGIPKSPADSSYYPVEAIDFLQRHQYSGNLLVYFDWGEYALWHLYPRFHVAVDGRNEWVYPQEICQLFFDFLSARSNWREFLQRFPPDFILLPVRSATAALLKNEPGWHICYSDIGCLLFQKN